MCICTNLHTVWTIARTHSNFFCAVCHNFVCYNSMQRDVKIEYNKKGSTWEEDERLFLNVRITQQMKFDKPEILI